MSLRAGLGLGVLMAVAACGGSKSGGPGGGGNGVPNVSDGVEPIESFEADKIAAMCAVNVRCNQVATADGCVAATLPIFSPQLVPDVEEGVISYDQHLAYRCLQLILAQPCSGGADLESCHDAFTGTLPGGAACRLDAECMSDSCQMANCPVGSECCPPGTCRDGVEVRDVPVGGTCGLCAEGEYCDETVNVCKARVGLGASCVGAICQQGLVCSNTSGTCVEPSELGGTCEGDFCDNEVSMCSAQATCVAVPQAGDPCTGNFCSVALNCVNGVCVTPGVIGQPCVGAEGSTQCQNGITALGSEEVACVYDVCAQRYAPPTDIACLSP